MDINNMKNVVVLKDLPSNIVDEAIILLKQNQKIKKHEYADIKNNNKEKIKHDSKDYIVKEAQMLISDYISRIEQKGKTSTADVVKLKNKCRVLKISNIFFAVSLLISIIIYFI